MTDSIRLAPVSAALAGALVLTCGADVSAAASPAARTTPAAMAKKIRGFVPQIPTDNGSAPSVITASSCRGLGKARRNGHGKKARRFTTFRCTATWAHGPSRVWARALPGGTFCASSTGLAACPATPPVAGDPRICHNPPAPPSGDPNHCARSAAEAVLARAMRANFADPSWTLGNVSCDGANLRWKCQFMQLDVFGVYYSATVRFAKTRDGWAATIVTTGGNGTSTCTGAPAATTAASRPSDWSAGPDPACTR